MSGTWLRVRFYTDADDWRPLIWPPPGPCWCTGAGEISGGKFWVVVAYVRRLDQVHEFWPEAYDVDHKQVTALLFTSRFPRPEWWPQEG